MFATIAHFQELAVSGYITYGNGQFDGQNSGHDYFGKLRQEIW